MVFDCLLAVTWRSQVDGASMVMTLSTVFTSCCALTTLMLQIFRHPKGSSAESHSWARLLVKEPGPQRRNGTKTLYWMERRAFWQLLSIVFLCKGM